MTLNERINDAIGILLGRGVGHANVIVDLILIGDVPPEIVDRFLEWDAGFDLKSMVPLAAKASAQGQRMVYDRYAPRGYCDYRSLAKLIELPQAAEWFTLLDVKLLVDVFTEGNRRYNEDIIQWEEFAPAIRKCNPKGLREWAEQMFDERWDNEPVAEFYAQLGVSQKRVEKLMVNALKFCSVQAAIDVSKLREKPGLTGEEITNLTKCCLSRREYEAGILAARQDKSGAMLEHAITYFVGNGDVDQAFEAVKHRKTPGLTPSEVYRLLDMTIARGKVDDALRVVALRQGNQNLDDVEREQLFLKLTGDIYQVV